jgi:hypothetical protein
VDGSQAIKTLSGLRLVLGAASWAAPRGTGRLFGLDPDANPAAPYLARLFGARDVALGWGTLGGSSQTRGQWLMAGVACDLADAAAGIAAGRGGYLPRHSSVMVSATALCAAALGARALLDA